MQNRNIKVLMVEDDKEDVKLVEEELSDVLDIRFEFTIVESMASAIKVLEDSIQDIVLLDLSLPDSTGFDTFKKVHDKTKVPIVILSGHKDENLAIKAISNGAHDYLVKGEIDKNLLIKTILYSIERDKTHQELCKFKDEFYIIAEDSSDFISIVDPDGKYLYKSPGYKSITGRLNGKGFFDEVYEDDKTIIKGIFQEIIQNGKKEIPEYRIVSENKDIKYIKSIGRPVYDLKGNVLEIVIVSQSINKDVIET